MITYLPYLSLLIVNTIYLFSALLYAKVVPKNRVYAQYIVYQLYNQKNEVVLEGQVKDIRKECEKYHNVEVLSLIHI